MFAGLSGSVRTQTDTLLADNTAKNSITTLQLPSTLINAVLYANPTQKAFQNMTGQAKKRGTPISPRTSGGHRKLSRLSKTATSAFGRNVPFSVRPGSESNKTVKDTSNSLIVGSSQPVSDTVGNSSFATPLEI